MGLYEELFLTAVLSLLLFFLIGKLAAPVIPRRRAPSVVDEVSSIDVKEVLPIAGEEVSPIDGEVVSPTAGEEVSPTAGDEFSPTAGEEVSPSAGNRAVADASHLLEDNPGDAAEAELPADALRDGSISPDAELRGDADVKGEEEIEAEVEPERGSKVDRSVEAAMGGEVDRSAEATVGSEVDRLVAAAEVEVGEEVAGEEEWEGIERSELEKLFCSATAFVVSKAGELALSKLSSDVQMQLYGLQKIATEGPCYESQPMALKLAARAKWNSWQRLGTMSPEDAMEEYISILSGNLPRWMGEKSSDQDTKSQLEFGTETPYLKEVMLGEADPEIGRKSENPSCIEGESAATGIHVAHEVLTQSFHVNLLSPIMLPFLCLLL